MSGFGEQLFEQKQMTTMLVVYYRPDYRHLLQEFSWQFLDVPPKFHRAHRFLNYWKEQIRVPIREVRLAVAGHLVPTGYLNPQFITA